MQFPLNLLFMWVTSLSNCRLLKLSLHKKHASHFMCNYRFAEKNLSLSPSLSLQRDFGEVKEKNVRKGQGKILNCKQRVVLTLPVLLGISSHWKFGYLCVQCFLLSHHLVCTGSVTSILLLTELLISTEDKELSRIRAPNSHLFNFQFIDMVCLFQ